MRRILFTLVAIFMTAALAAPDYFVSGSTLRGHTSPQGPVCVSNTVFFPGEMIVFHAAVYDRETGNLMGAAEVSDRGIQVIAQFEGESIPLSYIPHGDPEDPASWYWAAGWEIPADYPVGTMSYSLVVADNDGRSGSYEPVEQAIGIDLLTIVAPASGN